MNTAKVYFDKEGNEKTIWQMLKCEPEWVASRFQYMEKEIERLHSVIGSLESDARDCEHQVECRDKMIDKLISNKTEAVELVMKATKFIPKLGTAGWYQDARNFLKANEAKP